MPILTEALKSFARKRDRLGFIGEWIKDMCHDDPNFNVTVRNAGSVFDEATREEKADRYAASLVGQSPVGIGGFLNRTMAAQYHPDTARLSEFGTLETMGKSLKSILDLVSGRPFRAFKELGSILEEEIIIYLSQTNTLFQEINEKAMMTGEFANAFRDEIQMAAPEATRLGIGFEEFSAAVGDLVTNSGKFKLMSGETMKEMALASKFTKDMKEFVSMGRNFELIGLGIGDMSSLIEKMAMKSLTLGLNGKTITSMVNENLKQINRYGFKDGVEGLSRMAQKSVEFRMNMSEVFKLADAVWEPDKALDLVANLQVIGGAFGDLNDPIKLMYMATNNVEGLQDALIGAAESLVTFNDEQGRFEITGANLRRAKAIADETGVAYEELANGAIAAAERTAAAFDLASSSYEMDEEQIEFLTNLARMEGGRMVIDIPKPLREQFGLIGNQTQIALSEVTREQAETILLQKKLFEDIDPKDIPKRQVMALETIQRDASAVRGYMRVMVGQNAATIIEDALGIDSELVTGISGALEEMGEAGVGRLDNFAKEAIKQYENLKLLGNFGEKIINGIEGITEKLTDKIEKNQKAEINTEATLINSTKLENSGRNEPTPPPASNYVERVKVDVTLNPMSASLDRIAQIFWGDARFKDDFAKGFLNP